MYGTNDTDEMLPVRHYRSNDKVPAATSGLAFAQDISHKITNNSMMVEPATGMLISYTLKTEAVMHLTSSKWKQSDKVHDVILPLPGLDTIAGTDEALYSYKETMNVDKDKFNSIFGFAHK